jgi:AraC-like DNA-binding protein
MTAHPAPDLLGRILDLVQDSLDDPAQSPAVLARRAYLSRFHFDRLVAATTGEPPGALRRRLLLERAAHRLTTTDDPVVDIAVEAGYGSHEAFTRAFGKAYGATPSMVRTHPPLTFRQLELSCASGVHYQPPGGLRLPSHHQETDMDVLQQLVDHHVDTVTTIIQLASGLPDEILDRPRPGSTAGIDDDPTLRSIINAMVWQEEHWLSAFRGAGRPDQGDQSIPAIARRHDRAGRDYRRFVAQTLAAGTLADTFVDTTCTPPRTHTLGGIIGHVITFAAVRRTAAVAALTAAGIEGLDYGDPRPYLDAHGS